MALFKTRVPIQALARLLEELGKIPNQLQITEWPEETDPNGPGVRRNFVRVLPGERKFDGENIEISLELLETYQDTDIDRAMTGIVSKINRSMVNKLFDFLGVFPISGELPEDVEDLLMKVHNVATMIGTIVDFHVMDDMAARKIREEVGGLCEVERELTSRLEQLL
ncbi:MAG: hypothetical protein A3F53_02640 [Candidatus Zambryskibacteria bacterium RIFCSPHIGHO2_12_FULL_48_10]|uniref:Uncharacterized protein n=1 Tax=Candidatus Zambryskibacteria bacterium RIFCSPHIGHO2_01_FULL_46_25 TaxID=1802738 RepID=A0A1G2SZ10_9BACT|nr:MAG: hypothetical protein UX71_C0005G0078 [Parcubacteria group bacterium GW2011_GWA1_47_10]OHA90280.1 MAG: hypothetical protein A2838_01590 [Candidatus Zambryskibacteria bacterium RIFCSPHIGHO2_01_FULL_46_25]OHB02229.1 MAG: hypothetical protein A3F53_02640 [Candidatus Zambryskibacteria bacterium RIFCSPHIGHO2_12_FULL_48_10]OHB06818.1 MAG: hypothetical protein A3A31_00730 [Candidatus Zambryskibacteria bacterium RIFCSPLOWO2_01_FULL_48_25]